jgi:hypothetical protein
MMMLILLEGPDGVGKTTYANVIDQSLPKRERDYVEYIHAGPLRRHPLDEYVLGLAKYKPGDKITVCDRWHIGEMVYGPVLRSKVAYDKVQLLYIEMFLRSRGALNVVLVEAWSTLEARYHREGDDLINLQQLQNVWERYRDLQGLMMPLSYDCPTKTGHAGVVSTIEIARRLEQEVLHLAEHPVFVGNPQPRVLFVGERRNVNEERGRTHPAAFTPFNDTSGYYLLDCMIDAF